MMFAEIILFTLNLVIDVFFREVNQRGQHQIPESGEFVCDDLNVELESIPSVKVRSSL